jgi:adenylylsulfate reductase subunit A
VEYDLIQADVLIIGGGAAGLNAAIASADRGARVVVTDKGNIERSGNIGGGVDHFLAYLNREGSWDTREAFLEYVWKIGKGTGDPSIIDAVFCSELKEAVERMAGLGVPLTQPNGNFFRTKSMGQPGPYWVNFNGKQLKPCLAKGVRKLGCIVLDKVMAIDLITHEGKVAGAIGFNIRTGKLHVIEAKATVVSTGNTNRLYENPRLNPFNTWLCPFDTGDGQIMAFKAGAALTNMEYMRMTLLPKGFAAPGFNALVGMGGKFLNSLGDYYMEKSHPLGNRAPRYDVVFHSLRELREGRGPLFIDCTHLREGEISHLDATLGYDKDTLPDYLQQRGEELSERPVEINVSEGMQAGPTEVTGSGIKIDKDCASTVPGLFAAGDTADHNRCLHGAITGGYHAGKAAADYASKVPNIRLDISKIRDKVAEFDAPLRRKKGLTYRQLEDIIRKVMYEHVGVSRTAEGLRAGLAKLEKIEEYVNLLKADDYHEIMRVYEAKSILEVGKIMAQAALYREESRNKPYHHRLDFPDTDDERWCGLVVVKDDENRAELSFEKLSYK